MTLELCLLSLYLVSRAGRTSWVAWGSLGAQGWVEDKPSTLHVKEYLCLCDWSLQFWWASNWWDSVALLTGLQRPFLGLLRGCGGKSHKAVTGTDLPWDRCIGSQSPSLQLWIQRRQGQRGSDSTQTSLSGRIKNRLYTPTISLFLWFKIKIEACHFYYKVDGISQGSWSNFKTGHFSGTLQVSEHRS